MFHMNNPSNNALARSCNKSSFFLAPLQDLGRSYKFAGILQDSCMKFLQDYCEIPQDPAGTCKILQDLAGVQEKRTFCCKILKERFYWDGKYKT